MKPDEVLEMIEVARETGKIKKGINEATKAVERGVAKAVIVADDVEPKEITMHLPALCEEKNVQFYRVPSKVELGRSAGLDVGCACIAVTDLGESKKK